MVPHTDLEQLVGPHIKHLTHAFSRRFSERVRSLAGNDFPMVYGHILGYLYYQQNQGKPVYQRDIEGLCHITRSSVTGVVKLMEKKGYITRRSVPGDARLKELSLTSQGVETFLRSQQAMTQVEELATRGLTPEERQTFLSLCRRIETNLSDKNDQKEGFHAENHFVPGKRV